ncbi:MAG: hypothetical protein ABID87_04270 [Chloroflexota bacterium]
MYDTIAIEDLKKPAVALVNKDFVTDGKAAAQSQGMPNIRIVSETVPCECKIPADIEAGVNAAMSDVIAALTKPLTVAEKSPQARVEELPRTAFKGTLAEMNRFFYIRGWTDGFPVTPPTDEAVVEMLTGTDLPPDHIVGKLAPWKGKATVEKIAVNAVMAGALPTYMPLLIAGVEALLDPFTHYGVLGVSTGSFAPYWIINGPVRHDLNFNFRSGVLGPGNIANAAFGRAMRLIIQNIGGARKGIEDMGQFGNPAKYTAVLVENEEDSPWEPLHVEQGFRQEDSAVTLFFPQSFSQMMSYGTDDHGLLSTVIYNVIPGVRGLFCFLLNPSHAKILGDKGWTKQEVARFISEFATAPAYRNWEHWGAPKVPEKWRLASEPTDPIRILNNPEWIRVLVTGGPGNHIGLLTGGGAAAKGESPTGMDWVTRKVTLPANWDALVKKYKNLVPVWARH